MTASLAAIVCVFLIASLQSTTPTASSVAVQPLRASNHENATVDLSADGRFVAFVSWASLSPVDTNRLADVYVLDRTSGRVTLESLGFDGGEADGTNSHPRISGDGRFVVFNSVARNILPLPRRSPRSQVFLRDRQTGRTTLVSRTPAGDMSDGWSDGPDISDDGRFVVFESTATDLMVDADAKGLTQDVYRYEVGTHAIVRASVDDRGEQSSSGRSFAPSISGNGRFIAFTSSAPLDRAVTLRTGHGPRDRRGSQVFVRDMEAGTTRLASRTPDGREGSGASFHPVISADGRVVAFVSSATDLVRRDKNRLDDVFRYDTASGRTMLVSRSARGGGADNRSDWPALSADGRYVAFASEASNLICAWRCPRDLADRNLVADVYLSDSMTGTIVRVSGWDEAGGPWWEPSIGPTLDATGRIIAFSSRHPMDDDDLGSDFDLIVYAIVDGGTSTRRPSPPNSAPRANVVTGSP